MDSKVLYTSNIDINQTITKPINKNENNKNENNKNLNTKNLNTKQSLLMNTLNKFYKNEKNIEIISNVLQGTTKLSLRIIDWFVTNYSKKNNIVYNIKRLKNDKEVIEQFIVHLNYKNQLKAYSKKQFDPFCRRNRIQYDLNDDKFLITTVGQLNFFRWAIDNNVIDYLKEYIEDIENDMNENIKKHYKSKTKTKKYSKGIIKTERKKRRELSTSATKTLNKHKFNVVLDFN
jgi:hypothetical protein